MSSSRRYFDDVAAIRVTRRDQGGHGPPRFLAYADILCFERQCPKQNTIAWLKSKHLSPLKFWAVYAAGRCRRKTKRGALGRAKTSLVKRGNLIKSVREHTHAEFLGKMGRHKLARTYRKQSRATKTPIRKMLHPIWTFTALNELQHLSICDVWAISSRRFTQNSQPLQLGDMFIGF